MKPRILKILDEKGISYRILPMEKPAYTVEDVIRMTGVKKEQICKVLLLITRKSQKPVIAVISGSNRLDLKKIRQILGEKVRFATKDEIRRITGYEIGAVPPFGHKSRIRTLIDVKLLKQPKINFGTGVHKLGVEIKTQDLNKVMEFEVYDISEQDSNS